LSVVILVHRCWHT